MLRILLFASMLLAAQVPLASPSNKALERCFYLQEKIEHYTQLRRRGGSHSQMASWRSSRSRYEEEFGALRCSKFSRQLRRKKR